MSEPRFTGSTMVRQTTHLKSLSKRLSFIQVFINPFMMGRFKSKTAEIPSWEGGGFGFFRCYWGHGRSAGERGRVGTRIMTLGECSGEGRGREGADDEEG